MAEAQVAVPEVEEYIGCEHYRRKCSLLTPCCGKVYTCRVCHDDKENHQLNRIDVVQVQCLICRKVQKVQSTCDGCNVSFGKYFCAVCRLFDDKDKKQFHCDGCGLCRIGGRENYFHCEVCDVCLAKEMRNKHKCIVNSSHSNCAVCLEDLHTSRIAAHIPPCGHLIHYACFRDMIKTGNYACPICGESMVDMTNIWRHVDEEVANCQMPEEYKDFYVQILCRDCHKESRVLFHVLGLKCQHCGSYNTCRTKESEEDDHLEAPTNLVTGPAQPSVSNSASGGQSNSAESSVNGQGANNRGAESSDPCDSGRVPPDMENGFQ